MILSIINQIADNGSSLKKEAILKANKDNNTLMNVFRLAYNKRIVFGIKKIPERQLFRGIVTLDGALNELENCFATRKITGNAAIDRLQEIMGSMSESDAEVIKRVVKRDLECGASIASACKIWGDDLIPSQPCMKASSYSEKAIANIRFPAIAQLKADGTRCMIVKEDGVVTAYSRNGKEFTGIVHILDAIAKVDRDNFVLDGELVYKHDLGKKPEIPEPEYETARPGIVGDLSWMLGEQEREIELSKAKDFQEQDVVDRQTGNGIVSKAQKGTLTLEESNNIVLQAWDIIEAEDYWKGIDNTTYLIRINKARELINQIDDIHIEWIETHTVNNLDEAKAIYNQYVELELEGIILKNIHGPWEDTRSKHQVKFKEVITFDAKIVGTYPHKKDPNKLGGIVIESACGRIRNNCGSGFKDKTHTGSGKNKVLIPLHDRHEYDRELLYSMKEHLIDKIAELECNGAITRKNVKPGEPEFRLFLPVFKLIRWDKDEANTCLEVFGK